MIILKEIEKEKFFMYDSFTGYPKLVETEYKKRIMYEGIDIAIVKMHKTYAAYSFSCGKGLAASAKTINETIIAVKAVIDNIGVSKVNKLIKEALLDQKELRANLQKKIDYRDSLKESKEYPLASSKVDGLTVRKEIPNERSIDATLNDYEILKGIRRIPMKDFPGAAPNKMFYAADDIRRVKELATAINLSKEINPLIVVIDKEGPYVLEGGHRLAALYTLGIKEIPALVVIDND